MAKERLDEFEAVNPSPPSTRNASSLTRNQWLPPMQGMVKINCDGAIFSKENKTRIGVVIRDNRGLVLGSLSKQAPQAYAPLEIEAMTASAALQFRADLGFHHVILETDSQVLVKALLNDTKFLSVMGLVLDEIRISATCFNELHYSYIKRECSKIAHMLA